MGITTVLFAMIYKLMPTARTAWRDVWVGAVVTAVLFEVGKTLIGLYLGKSGVAETFAAARSVVLLAWVYYAAQVFLLGAEFTKVYADEHGSVAGAKAVASTAGHGSGRRGGHRRRTGRRGRRRGAVQRHATTRSPSRARLDDRHAAQHRTAHAPGIGRFGASGAAARGGDGRERGRPRAGRSAGARPPRQGRRGARAW